MLWRGQIQTKGYGVVRVDGQLRLAHRVAVELSGGDLSAGEVVGHRCDVRRCINPQHLTVQTQSENMREAHARGRAHVQRLGGGAKRRGPLSVDRLCELRVAAVAGRGTLEELAARFGLTPSQVAAALKYGA